jgi:hypothetical protein
MPPDTRGRVVTWTACNIGKGHGLRTRGDAGSVDLQEIDGCQGGARGRALILDVWPGPSQPLLEHDPAKACPGRDPSGYRFLEKIMLKLRGHQAWSNSDRCTTAFW